MTANRARKIAILMFLLSFSHFSLAQLEGPIATERPTQSVGSLVLPTNSFQFEQDFTFAYDTLTLNGFFRFGVSKIAELRILTYYDSPVVTYGAKVNVLQHKNYRPGIALKADITGGRISDYRIAIMQKISNSFGATVNFGVANNFYGALAIGYSFGDRFTAFIEGYFEDYKYEQYSAGLLVRVGSETQLDVMTGLFDSKEFYITVGFSRRIRFKNPKDE